MNEQLHKYILNNILKSSKNILKILRIFDVQSKWKKKASHYPSQSYYGTPDWINKLWIIVKLTVFKMY